MVNARSRVQDVQVRSVECDHDVLLLDATSFSTSAVLAPNRMQARSVIRSACCIHARVKREDLKFRRGKIGFDGKKGSNRKLKRN